MIQRIGVCCGGRGGGSELTSIELKMSLIFVKRKKKLATLEKRTRNCHENTDEKDLDKAF